MGNRDSKTVETVKAEILEPESLRDDSMSLVNLHLPSLFGGAMLIVGNTNCKGITIQLFRI